MQKPRLICSDCDGYGEDRCEVRCFACDGHGELYEVQHGPACDCDTCSRGLWVVADDGDVPMQGKHYYDRQTAIVACIETATLTGRMHCVRVAPMYDAPENGERAYNWNDRDSVVWDLYEP